MKQVRLFCMFFGTNYSRSLLTSVILITLCQRQHTNAIRCLHFLKWQRQWKYLRIGPMCVHVPDAYVHNVWSHKEKLDENLRCPDDFVIRRDLQISKSELVRQRVFYVTVAFCIWIKFFTSMWTYYWPVLIASWQVSGTEPCEVTVSVSQRH